MNKEKIISILLVAVLVLAFVVGLMWQRIGFLENPNPGATPAATATTGSGTLQAGKLPGEQAAKLPKIGSEGEHVRGAESPELFIVEYSDYECPYCKGFHESLQKILENYDNVAWVYRQFPIEQLHKQAMTESEAAECVASVAGEEAFWKFTDLLYSETASNDGLDLAKLPDYAKRAGADVGKFQSCLDNGDTKNRVEQIIAGATEVGVRGTPSSFIVNKKGEVWFVSGAQPYDQLKQMIETALGSN